MKTLEFLNSLRPALPWSVESCKLMSNGELRRHIQQGAVLINGSKVAVDQELTEITSVVFFPKSKTRRTTLF